MTAIESSIIIPVFNLWETTRSCLEALAATTVGKAVEVIVVDNASADATPMECPLLGKSLFGEAFHYHRCPQNLNFGPASNLGARLAKGEFLIFLNNDTTPLPGWYQPLIDDFAQWPDIAATGPLLLYPATEPFGHMVQHLGVCVSPDLSIGHLYEGIPADSPLAQKRRFFQIITAACMVMRRSTFLEAGSFDERYVNGFEDVDLCVALSRKGLRMTVNPEARVIHHTGQTPGRHTHDDANSRYFEERNLSRIIPDLHMHLQTDGMFVRVSPWQMLHASLPKTQCAHLDKIAAIAPPDVLKDILTRHPFWENGWRRLADMTESKPAKLILKSVVFRLFPSPENALDLHSHAYAEGNNSAADTAFINIMEFCKPYRSYLELADMKLQWYSTVKLADLAEQFSAWIADAERFRTEVYLPYLEKVLRLPVLSRFDSQENELRTAWQESSGIPG